MRDHLEAFIARGGNVAFFSGNTSFWQVRSEDGGRALVSWKRGLARDPAQRFGSCQGFARAVLASSQDTEPDTEPSAKTAAFCRGCYLLGLGYGVSYAAISVGLVWLLAQSLVVPWGPALGRAAVITALSLPVGFVMAFPAWINVAAAPPRSIGRRQRFLTGKGLK
jgi:hypothetical protein